MNPQMRLDEGINDIEISELQQRIAKLEEEIDKLKKKMEIIGVGADMHYE